MVKTFQNADNGILPEIATVVGKWGYVKAQGLRSVKETISRADSKENGGKAFPATLQRRVNLEVFF